MLTPAEMDRKIDEHFGYEARDDVAGVVATLAPDVTHDVVGWPGGPAYGRDNARPFYEAMFAEGKNRPLRFRLLHVVEFNERGELQRENVWCDLAAIIRQLPQA